MARTWYSMAVPDVGPAKVSIHDEIGLWGITARDFIRDLDAIGGARDILLSIQSPGGDVTEGLAIYNSIKRRPGRVVARVEGLAASMATVIAMAADEVVIPENALFMVHNPWTVAMGDADSLRDVADTLERIGAMITNIYAGKTGQTPEEIQALMKRETWLTGAEAVEAGFADTLEAPLRVAASFDARRYFMTVPDPLPLDQEGPTVEPTEFAPESAPESDTPVEPAVESETPEPTATPEEPQGVLGKLRSLFFGAPSGPSIQGIDPDIHAAVQARCDELARENETLRASVARLQSLESSLVALTGELEQAKASRARDIAETVATLGFTPAKAEAELPPVGEHEAKPSLLEQFRALSGAEARAFWNQHKDELVKLLDRKA